ncbi:acyl-CoA reductase [Pseudoflavitalea sp. G-6-1-2]|uniref:acyl-CoA reductase n=1 Tax=Pseudoflavitalea sp. G-6-1-2 TaxID=2728841 RepID=UPI00146F37A3|nr:acyl-CoA reductase [Pseudoflavitalea sp. G-6-1-2]NML20984.1 acyl-CoA reductase [Pseudoflavitalea sp. G-6-1-2]
MNLQKRLDLLERLGEYILAGGEDWQMARDRASRENGWFTPEFIDLAANRIAVHFLAKDKLAAWAAQYKIPQDNPAPKNVGIIMAGNIPLVGFHDFLCVFISGHRQTIKLSSKDDVLMRHLASQLWQWDEETKDLVRFETMLKGCDAYIATGSNNSARYFDYYFAKYPHIIRRNRTSVAVLTGNETTAELEKLADDVHEYFGMGCRNVTKMYVPKDYDFLPLLNVFRKYNYFADHNKYKNNYDYQLAILILNKQYYMTNDSIILHENTAVYSPISQLNYEFYSDAAAVESDLKNNESIQCIAGAGYTSFGEAQQPSLTDYADGVDTLQFLLKL